MRFAIKRCGRRATTSTPKPHRRRVPRPRGSVDLHVVHVHVDGRNLSLGRRAEERGEQAGGARTQGIQAAATHLLGTINVPDATSQAFTPDNGFSPYGHVVSMPGGIAVLYRSATGTRLLRMKL